VPFALASDMASMKACTPSTLQKKAQKGGYIVLLFFFGGGCWFGCCCLIVYLGPHPAAPDGLDGGPGPHAPGLALAPRRHGGDLEGHTKGCGIEGQGTGVKVRVLGHTAREAKGMQRTWKGHGGYLEVPRKREPEGQAQVDGAEPLLLHLEVHLHTP
jgi:hypothetical protein